MSDYEYISWYIKSLPLIGTFSGILISFIFNYLFLLFYEKSKYNKKIAIIFSQNLGSFFISTLIKIKVFLSNKWWLDFILNNYIGIYVLKHSYETCYKILDKGIFEIFIVNGFSFFFMKNSRFISLQQGGYLYSTICFIIICLLFLFNLSFFF
jgi:hypothetical protein